MEPLLYIGTMQSTGDSDSRTQIQHSRKPWTDTELTSGHSYDIPRAQKKGTLPSLGNRKGR